MTIYVLTCDRYDHLLPGFAYMFNKYWGPDEVRLLCYRPPPLKLPDNFTWTSLGVDDRRIAWTDSLRPFFAEHATQQFVLLLDDYWLIEPVDHNAVAVLRACLQKDAVKADLTNNVAAFGAQPYGQGLLVANPEAKYRTSLQPAIWTRDYFLRFMRPGWSIWDFERLGSRTAKGPERIVGLDPASGVAFRYANVYKKGKPDVKNIARIPQVDREPLYDLGYAELMGRPL